jgi:dCMP deaminase
LSWDDYFMAVAFLSAQRSKDPNKQVGACIVDRANVICGIGYNGFPRGCPDSRLPWAKRAPDGDPLRTKYPYVCHAEMNAILNKNGASVAGARVFVTMFPCNECAKLLIQAGIAEIVYHEDKAQPRAETPAPGGFK